MDASPVASVSAALLAQLRVLEHEKLGSFITNPLCSVWLYVRWDIVKNSIPAILAALRVLAQLSRTNKRAWVQVLLQFWPAFERTSWMRHQMRELNHTCVIGLRIECRQSDDLPDSITDRWLESMTDLSRDSDNEVPVVPMDFYFCRVSGIAQTMEAIGELVAPRGIVAPRLYRVASMSFNAVVMNELDLHAIANVARRGVMISELSRVNCELTTRNAAAFVTGLQALMLPHEPASTSIFTMPLAFADENSTRSQLCVLSAIGASRYVHKLFVDCYRVLDEHVVRWLAFSLISSCARHDLTQLSVMGEIVNARLAQVFRQVVQARDPVAELFTEHRSSVEAHESTRISASRFYLYGPNNVAVECRQQKVLRVITREAEWWSVLLPAWGRAWVHMDDTTVTTLQAEAEGRVVRPVSRLTLHGGFAEMLPFLEVVGHGVKELAPTGCIDVLASRYAHYQQHAVEDNDDPCQEVITLLRALSDSDTDVAKTLRSLTITMTCTAHDYTPLVDAMLEMLNDNTRLRCLRLALPRGAEFRNETVSGICAQRGVPIYERQAPLGMRYKCALIAAVVGQQGSWWDSNILATIFQFAAVCRLRYVEVLL